MQVFRSGTKKSGGGIAGSKSSFATNKAIQSQASYASKVSLYRIPPEDDVSLDEFEQYSYDRLKGESIYVCFSYVCAIANDVVW